MVLALAGSSSFPQTKPKQDVLDKKDTRVEPTHWGNVYGRVYDASTGAPIPGATISLETDEGFLDKGRSAGKTDELGGYHAQCILGRISHNFDVGRALLTTGIGMLFGAANNTTKRIDASRVEVRVRAFGYKDFEGVVVARSSDAGAFRIDVEPVLLVPVTTDGVSVAAMGWTAVRITNAKAEPEIGHKGDVVHLNVSVRAFGKNPAKNIEIVAVSRLWRGERRMDVAKVQSDPGSVTFTTDYKIGGHEKNGAEAVYFRIRRSILDCDTHQFKVAALVQIAGNPEQEKNAKDRVTVLNYVGGGQYNEAMQLLKILVGVPNPTPCDVELLAGAADRCSDYETEAAAWEQMARMKDVDFSFGVTQQARALYLAKKYEEVNDLIWPELTRYKPRNWPERLRPDEVGYFGLSCLKLGNLERAQKLNKDLLDWAVCGVAPSVIAFRNNLRLAEVEKANADAPNSPAAIADYGRALLDLGRYEEAVAKLKKSLDMDPTQPAIKRDIAWAALQMHGPPPGTKDLEAAVEEAKAGLTINNGKEKSKDFFAWDKYAVLLYALSEQRRVAGSPDADKTSDEAIQALREALTLGRVGALTNSGDFNYRYGYTSGSEVAISGFASPQANFSFTLLDSLKKLRKDPNNYLALFNKAASLMDLGQNTLAEEAANQLLAMRPDFVEGKYLMALIQIRDGDIPKGEDTLRKVISLNPLHPRANLVLAQLLAKDGDVAGSAERLAAHAKFYGEAIPEQ